LRHVRRAVVPHWAGQSCEEVFGKDGGLCGKNNGSYAKTCRQGWNYFEKKRIFFKKHLPKAEEMVYNNGRNNNEGLSKKEQRPPPTTGGAHK